MKRKLVKQGNSALTVSLPAEWARKFKLQGGDEVSVSEEDGFLKISATEGKKAVSIDISELSEALVWTYIISAYRKGYDEIKVKFKREQIELVQRVVNALLGLAIIEQSKDSCTIKDISEYPAESEFKNIMRRIFYLIEEIGESTLNAVREKSKVTLKSIEFQDYNINKFANFCLRLINKKNLSSSFDFLISELENMGDEYTRLALDLAEEKNYKVSEKLFEIFKETNSLFVFFHSFYYSFDNKKAEEVVKRKIKLNNMIHSANAKNNAEMIILYHLGKIIHLITNLGERVVMINLT